MSSSPDGAYVYLLLCRNRAIYTGTTRDLEKRMRTHFEKRPGVAAYTRSAGAVRLLAAWRAPTYGDALRAECRIKKRTHAEKEALAKDPTGIASGKYALPAEWGLIPLLPGDALLEKINRQYACRREDPTGDAMPGEEPVGAAPENQ